MKFQIPSLFVVGLLLALSIVLPLAGHAQYRTDRGAEDAFERALGLFRQERYDDAGRLFDSLANLPVVHQKTSASYVMLAKTLFRRRDYAQSIAVLDTLRRRFPSTTFEDDIEYTLGTDAMMLQKHPQAFGHFLRVAESSTDTTLLRLSNELLTFLLHERLTAEELEPFIATARTEAMKDRIAARLVALLADRGDHAKAEKLLAERLAVAATGSQRSELLRAGETLRQASHIRIGVLFPLTGGAGIGPIARELLEGMNVALRQFTKTLPPSTSITLDVRDVGRDSMDALAAVRELAVKPDLVCIVGPLFSDLVATVAPVVNREHIPLVSPTATTTGLAATGPYIFQTTPDFAARGKAMAQYAMSTLGLKRFAVFRTTEPMGASGTAFAEEVTRGGGKVIVQDTFHAGATSLQEQFHNLRRAALGNDHDANTLDLPVTVDGLYCAIDDADEIVAILPQLKYFNIRTALLGNNEWYDPAELARQKKEVEGLLIGSDSYLGPELSSTDAWQTLASAVPSPTKYHAIGFDVMRLILACTENGASSREKLRAALSAAPTFTGVHATIALGASRVNQALQILRCRDGQAVREGVSINR